jgi:glycerophosphoryl diester phosphodiesterase
VASGSGFFEHPGTLAFAHRGGAAEAPENSWSAFEHAVALGFRYMETDVRTTADAVPVAMHDPDLVRVTGRPGQVSRLTWRQVQAMPLRDGRQVPRLEDLLGTWPDLRWNIDVKRREAVVPVVEAIKRTGSKHRVLIAAFSDRRTEMVRAVLGPGLATGAGRWTIALMVGTKVLPLVAFRPKAAAAQVPVRSNGISIVNAAFIRACHRVGMAVHVWTIDDPAEMTRLLDLGVDGIMTDRPSTLKEVLAGRGQWS